MAKKATPIVENEVDQTVDQAIEAAPETAPQESPVEINLPEAAPQVSTIELNLPKAEPEQAGHHSRDFGKPGNRYDAIVEQPSEPAQDGGQEEAQV